MKKMVLREGIQKKWQSTSWEDFFGGGEGASHMAYGILVPQSGIEPRSPAGETQSPNHWTAREFPKLFILENFKLT